MEREIDPEIEIEKEIEIEIEIEIINWNVIDTDRDDKEMDTDRDDKEMDTDVSMEIEIDSVVDTYAER